MRAGVLALALLLSSAVPAAPAGDPDWHIPLAPDTAGESQRPEAVRLRAALARYRQLAADGGWPELPAGTILQAGQRDERVALLRDRLRISGDFNGLPATADAWFFDQPTAAGPAVLPASPRPARLRSTRRAHARGTQRTGRRSRIQQLQATLTRWNWLPRDPGPRYLWVNVVTGTLEARRPARDRPADAGHRRPSQPADAELPGRQSGRSSSIRPGPCRTPSPSKTCCRPSRQIPTSSRGSASGCFAAAAPMPAKWMPARSTGSASARSASPTACCRNPAR